MKARTSLTAAAMAVATGVAVISTALPGNAAPKQTLTVTATPHSNLVNNKAVAVKATGFSSSDNGAPGVVAAECSIAVAKSGSPNDCDSHTIQPVTVASQTGTATVTVLTGKNYSDANGGKCDKANSCVIVVENELNTAEAGGTPITFKSPKAKTKTKVSSKKTVKKGKKLTITVKESPKGTAKFSGHVKLTVNGHKLGKVKESKSGKVKFKGKFKKAGKYTIKAKYTGNSAYKGSTGKEKIKVKK